MIVLFASTSGVAGSAGRRVWHGVASAVAVMAVVMLLACTAALGLATRVDRVDAEAFSRLILGNAAMHLTLPVSNGHRL